MGVIKNKQRASKDVGPAEIEGDGRRAGGGRRIDRGHPSRRQTAPPHPRPGATHSAAIAKPHPFFMRGGESRDFPIEFPGYRERSDNWNIIARRRRRRTAIYLTLF